MPDETDILTRLPVVFNGLAVVLHAHTHGLSGRLQKLFRYMLGRPGGEEACLLHLYLRKISHQYYTLEAPAHRGEKGSIGYILHHAREWATRAFINGSPELLWLHASGVECNNRAVLICGPAGAGKSTLAVELVSQGWRFLTDDLIPVDPSNLRVLPFPFTPGVRSIPYLEDSAWEAFLEQEKSRVDLSPEQVCLEPVALGAIVFPEYSATEQDQARFEPVTTVKSTYRLMNQCVQYDRQKEQTIARLFELTRSIPSFGLRYGDSVAAAKRIIAALQLRQPYPN